MNLQKTISIVLFVLFSQSLLAQNVGINATGVNPDNSAMLDIVSTDKGILIPRVSIANLSTAAPVTTPSNSLLVFNTNAATGEGYYYWDNANTTWVKLLDANSNSDEDWHKANTTTSPTSINDDIFTNGNVGIGLNNPAFSLDIASGNIELDSDYGIGRANGSASSEFKFYPHRTGINALTGYGSVAPFSNGMTLETDALLGFVETDANKLSGYMDLNSNKFIWDGKIGVGTENPGAQITVKGDARIRLDNNINYQWDLNVDNTNSKFAIEALNNFTSKGNRFVIDTMGLVGIGANTPTARLEVKHNVNEFAVRIFNTQSAGGNGLLIESNGGSNDDTLFHIRGDLDGAPFNLFTVVGDGRVGVNQDNPNTQTKLDVNGYMIGQNFFFSAYSSSAVANFTNGVVTFAQEHDPHNDYAANVYTAPVAGYYFFSTDITFDGGDGTDDTMVLHFRKNGASVNSLNINPHFTSTGAGLEVNYSSSTIMLLAAGDQVDVYIDNVDTAGANPIVDYRKRRFMGYMISK